MTTMDKLWSEKLTWAFGSGKLKINGGIETGHSGQVAAEEVAIMADATVKDRIMVAVQCCMIFS